MPHQHSYICAVPILSTGFLKCHSMHSNTLDVATVNNITLDKLLPRLVTRNANVTLTGWLIYNYLFMAGCYSVQSLCQGAPMLTIIS